MRKIRIDYYWIIILIGLLFWMSCSERTSVEASYSETAHLEKKIEMMAGEIQRLEEKAQSSTKLKTLETVLKRGYLIAGINGNVQGFSAKDKGGFFKGLDVDTAKAIAAAIFGDAERVEFKTLNPVDRLPALQSGSIDVLCRNTSQTLFRETAEKLNFTHPTYYDGQGFLVPKRKGIRSAKQLDGFSVCVLWNTTTELNASDFFRENKMQWRPVVMEKQKDLFAAFFKGECDCLTTDASQLAIQRYFAKNAKDYIILPEIISKEPLAPAVRHGDDQWFDIVNFTVYALIAAEEYGITKENVDSQLKNTTPKIRRFLGVTQGTGKALGLEDRWTYHIIKQVGNYGEIFNRHLGSGTPLRMRRGLNALWKDGGLMYAPPFQ